MDTSFLISQDGLITRCVQTLPESGPISRIVLGVHGIGGSTQDDIQRSLAEEMALFGSAVFRFDLPGHGESPMDGDAFTLKNCMQSLLDTAREAKRRFPEIRDLCVFASGFGAYVTLAAMDGLLALPGNVRLVIQTPSARMDLTILAMCGISRETLWAMDRYVLNTPRPLTITYAFYEELVEHFVINPSPIPMLILHGEEDSYIRMSDVRALRGMNEKSRLVIIPGTSHRFLEDGAWDMVLDLTRDWFEFQQVLLCDWE